MHPNIRAEEVPPGDGPSSSERAAKRRRCSPSYNDTAVDNDTTAKQLALPPEVWAYVMEFLSFDMILTCGVVSHSMLHESMPLLTKLRIDKAAQMNLAVASRFRDITDIHINSLLSLEVQNEGTFDEFTDFSVNFGTRIRVVPFLSRFVQTLERVHFGGKDEEGKDIEGFAPAAEYFFEEDEGYPHEGPRESMLAFIDMLSGAFQCGAFQNLQISGLCCPNIRLRLGIQCMTCRMACKSFPLESAIEFESKGSSVSNARSERRYGLDVCLPILEVEDIIESRPGGKDLLLSPDRLLRLLGSGRRYEIKHDDNGSALMVVIYEKTILDEIKRVVEYAKLDVKKISTEKLNEAVSRSFVKGSSPTPKRRCFLSEASLTSLREIGIFIETSEVCGNISDFLRYVKPIVEILVQYYDEEAIHNRMEYRDYAYKDIVGDCLKLIRRLLELENDAPIHEMDDRVISCLAEALDYDTGCHYLEVASSLGIMFAKGTEEQKKMIINAGVITKFTRHLNSSEVSITKIALLGLVDILVDKKKEHVEALVQAGGIPKLVELLHSSDDVRSKGSQSLLVILANDHIQQVIDAKAHEGLFRIMLSDDQVESLPKCSNLLRKMFEVANPPIQQAIDANLVQRVAHILNTSEDETVLTNLACVCISIALAANEDTIDLVMRVTCLLPLLVSLQDSPIDDVSEKAIACLEHVSGIRSAFNAESKDLLAWGEYRMLDLVDSDAESLVSFEEAIEVSDEQVALEEQQAAAADAPIYFYEDLIACDEDKKEETPTVLGIPRNLLQTILIYATETQVEVNKLATVCTRFAMAVDSHDDGIDVEGFRFLHPEFGYRKSTVGLRYVRKFQKSVDNEIVEILCTKVEVDGKPDLYDLYADELISIASTLLTRMNHLGPAASFRLRGDTVHYLFGTCEKGNRETNLFVCHICLS